MIGAYRKPVDRKMGRKLAEAAVGFLRNPRRRSPQQFTGMRNVLIADPGLPRHIAAARRCQASSRQDLPRSNKRWMPKVGHELKYPHGFLNASGTRGRRFKSRHPDQSLFAMNDDFLAGEHPGGTVLFGSELAALAPVFRLPVQIDATTRSSRRSEIDLARFRRKADAVSKRLLHYSQL